MTYLSKNIFRLHISEKKMSSAIIQVFNSKIYENPYIYTDKLSIIPAKSIILPSMDNHLIIIKKKIVGVTNITIGHGSIIKADLFDDPDRFVPLTIQYLIKIFEKGPKVINSSLIKQVLETFNFPNNTRYYLIEKSKMDSFLNVNKGIYSYITYS